MLVREGAAAPSIAFVAIHLPEPTMPQQRLVAEAIATPTAWAAGRSDRRRQARPAVVVERLDISDA